VNNEKKFVLLGQLLLKILNSEYVFQYLEMVFPVNVIPHASSKPCSKYSI
jgi:hypothetical protein